LLTPDALCRRLCLCLGVLIVLWTFIAILADVFQCSLPNPWMIIGNQCIDRDAFWMAFFILECVFNALLIALPFGILWGLQVGRWQKIALWCCFGSRISVIAAVIVQLITFNRAYGSLDFLRNLWPSAVTAEVVLCLSIIIPCVPYLRPFLESLDSGYLRHDGIRRIGQSELSSQSNASSFGLQKFSNRSKSKSATKNSRSKTGTMSGQENGLHSADCIDSHPHAGRAVDGRFAPWLELPTEPYGSVIVLSFFLTVRLWLKLFRKPVKNPTIHVFAY